MFLSSLQLLSAVLQWYSSAQPPIAAHILRNHLETYIVALVTKLGERQQRTRESAALKLIALCRKGSPIGLDFLLGLLLRYLG